MPNERRLEFDGLPDDEQDFLLAFSLVNKVPNVGIGLSNGSVLSNTVLPNGASRRINPAGGRLPLITANTVKEKTVTGPGRIRDLADRLPEGMDAVRGYLTDDLLALIAEI